jgi:hypothetical protein
MSVIKADILSFCKTLATVITAPPSNCVPHSQSCFTSSSTVEWYQARLTRASADRNGWDVEYSDGDVDSSICRQCVRPYQPFDLDEKVEVQIEPSVYSPGKVVAMSYDDNDEYYDIKLSDGTVLGNIESGKIRRVSRKGVIEPGTPVVVKKRYKGYILHINPNGSYDIQFNDNDYQANVSPKSVKIKH